MQLADAFSVTARGSSDSRAVHAHALTKRYGEHVAISNLELSVGYGSVYGFLGPNGSGKTTTIRMLLGLIEPSDGYCELFGQRMPESAATALPHVGTLVDGPAFHPDLSGQDNLRRLDAADVTADARTVSQRVSSALDRVGLLAVARKRFRNYSLGMKQRLAIAAALLRPRQLLILDEPTNGLDPQGTREVRSLICDLAADGLTVLLSTHLLSEVEQLCTHVGVMRRGNLAMQGTLRELLDTADTTVQVDGENTQAISEVLQGLGMSATQHHPGRVSANLGDVEPEKIVADIVSAGIPIRGFNVIEPTLEEVFITLTGEGFDVSD